MFIRPLAAALFFLSWMVLFPGSLTVGVYAKVTEDSGWHHIATRHTIIHYQSIGDLNQFNRKVAYHTGKWGVLSTIFGSNSDALHDKIRKKVDGIFEKTQHLLGMRKPMDKVHIYICRDRKQLNDHSISIYGRPSRFRAWYVYQLNAVYVNRGDLDEGILSHELAHSIIDHYLLVRPPKATAEILASYVDLHLYD